MRQQRLDALQAQQQAAQKALEDAQKAAAQNKDKNAKIDPQLQENLKNAEAAAREQYEAEVKSQKLEKAEEQAQSSRTWQPAN